MRAPQLNRAELAPKTREVRVPAPFTNVQRWTLPAYSARLEAQPGESASDLAVRTNLHNRDLWTELQALSKNFMHAVASVGSGHTLAATPGHKTNQPCWQQTVVQPHHAPCFTTL